MEKIGVSAFENCESLESIEIPDSLREIHGGGFSGCSNLKNILFGEESNLIALEDHCFRGCKGLEEIKIPKNVKRIGISAFRECSNLNKVILPEACRNEPGILEISEDKLEFYKEVLEESLV